MGDYAPAYAGGKQPYTSTASATITGGQVLANSGDSTVGPAGAASTVVAGVAAHDAVSGGKIAVWPLEGVVHQLVAANAITAGGGVQTAAAGQVDPVTTSIAAGSAAGTLIGTAATTAAGTPLTLRVLGRR
jgi:hypothetical protein